MNKIVLYLTMFLIILNVQKDSLLYNWNWIGWKCSSYESILILFFLLFVNIRHWFVISRGGSRGRRTRRAPPLKLEKNIIFGRKIVIFHTKYPKNVRASLRNWKKYDFFGVKSWFFTRNSPTIFAPPSARRNFFKCAPPNLKSWIRPWLVLYILIACLLCTYLM